MTSLYFLKDFLNIKANLNRTIYYNMHVCVLSHIQLFATLWTVACQAPLSVGFSRPEYWSGLPFPPSRESS